MRRSATPNCDCASEGDWSGESGFVKAALCGNRVEPQVEGMLDASPAANLSCS